MTVSAYADNTIRVTTAKGLSAATTFIAIEKGYYRDAGLNVVVEDVKSASDVLVLLSTGRLEVVEGGVGAGYFNAIRLGSSIQIIGDRVSSPTEHKILVRKGLKINDIADLKGLRFANNANGSVNVYEMAKLLEHANLPYNVLNESIMNFPSMGAALSIGAVDIALLPQPFASQFVDLGLADLAMHIDQYVKPITISTIMINTEWAKKNPEQAEKYYIATQRAAREYCLAYHHGPNRKEIMDIIIKHELETRVDFLNRYPWPSRNASGGHVDKNNILDIQRVFNSIGIIKTVQPVEKLVTDYYADLALKQLGPFVVDSKLEGCR
jgi:NitT/TauT family transport system substrate-binding protein